MNSYRTKPVWLRRIALALAGMLGLLAVWPGVSQIKANAQEEPLEVLETFPVNGGQDVLPSSGLEITFNSEMVSGTALAEAVTISPEIQYYVTAGADARTLVLAPYGKYEPETQYTVTVKKGLTDGHGRVLQEDVTFSFITASEDLSKLDVGMSLAVPGQGTLVNALTNETPAFFLMVEPNLMEYFGENQPEAQITLYRFDTDEDFLRALFKKLNRTDSYWRKKEEDPSMGRGVHEETAFTVKAEEVSGMNYWWWQRQFVLSFPEALAEGRYLAKVDFVVTTPHQDVTVTKYVLIQSTALSAFAMASGDNVLAWLHNGATGEKVANAQVNLTTSWKYLTGTTGEDGSALLAQNREKQAAYRNSVIAGVTKKFPSEFCLVDIQADGHRFLEAIYGETLTYGYNFLGTENANEKYYTYLYTDRQIYQTTDEIRFFGVVKPRDPETPVPKSVKVGLNQGWWSMDSIAQTEVFPDAQGCFTGTISFEDQQAVYWASLSVQDEDGNSLVSSESFRIEEYIKPVYKTDSSVDKPVYVLGKDRDQEAVVDLSVHYFDETPAVGLHMIEEWSGRGLTGSGETLTADKDGHMQDHVALNADSFDDSWYPQTVTIRYESADIEDEKLYIDRNICIIPRDVMLTTENDAENETLKIHTYAIDTSRIESETDLFDTENLKGEGLSLPVEGTVYKCWYEKISDGMRYDYIYKKSYEAYHYDYHEDVVETCVINTVDGEGTFTYHYEQDEETPACYYIKLTVKDRAERNVTTSASLVYRSLNRFINPSQETVYRLKSLTEEEETEELFAWRRYRTPQGSFSESAPAEFVLVLNEEEFEMPEGAELLSAVAQKGFTNVQIGTDVERSVEFSEDLLPNYLMAGAYFDGRNTWPLVTTPMRFDYKTRNLSLTISGEKEVYEPGEVITVKVQALRGDTGEIVPTGTRVALGVVDEAVFALADQEIRVLEKLYAPFDVSCSSYSSRNTLSASEDRAGGSKYTNELAIEEEAESIPDTGRRANGMNTEEHVRSEFKDSAYFAMAQTEADGTASFTLVLPDNMTSWRLSAIAVTEDVWAGSATKDIICTSPYYTVPVINDIMLEGDTFAIGLRSAGTVEDTVGCEYEVSVRAQDSDEVLYSGTAKGETLRDYTWVMIDGLTEGSYVVRIKGICGEYTDVSEYPFEVVRSGLQAYASLTVPVAELPEIHPLRYPVEVMVYDKNAFVYNAVLSSLLCSKGIRADERIGAHYAMTVLAKNGSEYFEKMLEEDDISDLRYIFPLFAYAKNNAEISALAYLAAPEILGSGVVRKIQPTDIRQELQSLYTGSPYAAYLFQALAKEAFTNDPAVLVHEEGLAFRDRIYLMAALFSAGRTEEAEKAYETYVKPYLKSSEAVSGQVVYFLNVDEKTTVQDDTAAALIMASLLRKEEARGLALYLLEKPSDRNIYPLEQILFLKNCELKDAPACTVSYVLDGKTVTEELKGGRRIYLNLQKKALSELNLTAVSGDPYVTIFYITSLAEAMENADSQKLTATVSFDKESYKPGDEAVITVTPSIGTLDPSIGCSTMVLDVVIPSGMRFTRYTPDEWTGNHWYLVSREGQRLRFVIYDGSGNRSGLFKPVHFTVSCVTPGDYVMESVYISSNHYDTWGMSGRGSVKVAEK